MKPRDLSSITWDLEKALKYDLSYWKQEKRKADKIIKRIEKQIHKIKYKKCPVCKGTKFKTYKGNPKAIIDTSFTIPCIECNSTGYVRRKNARPKKNK